MSQVQGNITPQMMRDESRTPAGADDRSGSLMLGNSNEGYGVVAILLHWVTALVIIGLFALGLWMVDLTYYDEWYKRAPDLHKGVGVLLFLVMLLRLVWRNLNDKPEPAAGVTALENRLAGAVHHLLYALIFAVMISGYLISTADGRSIDVFGLFIVPALISGLPDQADIAGKVHLVLAVSLLSLAALHALAALKHHFFNRDLTLKRMLRAVRKS
jgi:cytochrome b561